MLFYKKSSLLTKKWIVPYIIILCLFCNQFTGSACDSSGYTMNSITDVGGGNWEIDFTVCFATQNAAGGTLGDSYGFQIVISNANIISATPNALNNNATGADDQTINSVIDNSGGPAQTTATWGDPATPNVPPFVNSALASLPASDCYNVLVTVDAYPTAWRGNGQEEGQCPNSILATGYDGTFPQQCNADAGTYTADVGALNGGVWEVILCDNESVNITSNDDYTLPPPAGLLDPVALGYAVYDCAPTTGDPDTDPCFTGWYFTGEDVSEINAAGNDYEFFVNNPIAGFATVSGNDLYYIPVTMDDACTDILSLCDAALGHDVDGDGCYDMGVPIHITYLPQVTVTINSNCDPTTNTGSLTFTIDGGTPSANGSNFTITNSGAGSPDITIVPDGGTVTYAGLNHAETVTFNLSDDNCDYGDVSQFFDCGVDACLINSTLTATPPVTDFPNNQYPPNTTVEFCFTVDEYLQTAVNFLHGIVPSFSGEWDPASITPTVNPTVAANNEPGSAWQWLGGNTIDINATGVLIPDAGWWFFSTNSPGGFPADANNSWGDGCTAICYPGPAVDQAACLAVGFTDWIPGCGCIPSTNFIVNPFSWDLWVGPAAPSDIIDPAMNQTVCLSQNGTWDAANNFCIYPFGTCWGNVVDGFGLQWNACFEITTLDCVDPIGNPNGPLGISIKTWADGETGIWTDPGCSVDQPVTADYTLCCIPPPTVVSPQIFCEDVDVALTATLTDPTYSISWYNSNPPGLPIGTGTNYNAGMLNPGNYTFYVEQDNAGCKSELDSIEVTVNPLPEIVLDAIDDEICNGDVANIATTVTDAVTIAWDDPANSSFDDITVSPTVNTLYQAVVTNACGTDTLDVQVNVFEEPDISTVDAPSVCDGEAYDLTNVTINDAIAWPIGVQDTTITYHTGTPATSANEIIGAPIVTPTSPSSTYYILSTNYICSDELPITVTVDPLPLIEDTIVRVCPDVAIMVDLNLYNVGVNPTETVTWYNGDPNGVGVIIFPDTNVDLTAPGMDLWASVDDGTCENTIDITEDLLLATDPLCSCLPPDFINN